ncbi:hypothetical protein [Hydrogenophaga sp. NFH-34]|uniref:hypothetical protein n=1 Tax=Hydrogenophaga sp. NFH-34 TaxID=2744446 RepID=UPI001F172908|nr:hypothetical protein [Hydrogenophaga sp. NFH-34]
MPNHFANESQIEAVAVADAHTSNAALPTYSELLAFTRRLAFPDTGDALLLEDYRNIARNIDHMQPNPR